MHLTTVSTTLMCLCSQLFHLHMKQWIWRDFLLLCICMLFLYEVSDTARVRGRNTTVFLFQFFVFFTSLTIPPCPPPPPPPVPASKPKFGIYMASGKCYPQWLSGRCRCLLRSNSVHSPYCMHYVFPPSNSQSRWLFCVKGKDYSKLNKISEV